jgi:hypothetical protein
LHVGVLPLLIVRGPPTQFEFASREVAMPLCQLALVSETDRVDAGELMTVSAALQKQVTRDFGPIWDIEATVDPFARLEDVPVGYWPIMIRNSLHGEGPGTHKSRNNQPFALVEWGRDWPWTASHEALEMLADPFESRLIAGEAPDGTGRRVEFLVEVSDPCQEFGYTVNGIFLSDFYTPEYFDPVTAPGVRYSFNGSLTGPRTVAPGGYVTWHDPVTDDWWQKTFFDSQEAVQNIGPIIPPAGRSFRGTIDLLMWRKRPRKSRAAAARLTSAAKKRKAAARASESQAASLRQQFPVLRTK